MFGWSRSHGSQDKREFKVVIYEDDYKELCAWVLRKPHIETGGDLFGLWADKYSAVIQLVLGPGKGCRRSSTSFYQDVNYLEKVGKHLTQKEGVCHIGEWHSHHQLGLARPSGGDENTVWSNMPTYNLTRFVIFIANIDHFWQSYSVNVGCFLFEINSDGKRLPVKSGTFNILHKNSPFFGKVEDFKRDGEEEKKGDEFNVDIKNLTLTQGEKTPPSVTINHSKKRTDGRGNEPTDQPPQKKKNKTNSPPMTAQSQRDKQKESQDSSKTDKNKLQDPKTTEHRDKITQREEAGNEPPEKLHQSDEHRDSKTSDAEDGENNQGGPNNSNDNGEAQNKEDRRIKTKDTKKEEENKEEKKIPQAPDIQEKANKVPQTHQKQENSLGNNVDQDNEKMSNRCETEKKTSKNASEEIRLKGEGHQIEENSPGANFDQDKAKPQATNTEPGESLPGWPLATSGHAEDGKDEQEGEGNEGATQNKGTEEERSLVNKGSAAPDSKEPQGSLNTKKEAGNATGQPGQDLENSEKRSPEKEKQENDPEIENKGDCGGKESHESLDNKGKPPEKTKRNTKHEKSLDAEKGPNLDQKKKRKSVPGTDPNPTKNSGAKEKPKQGVAASQAPSSKEKEKKGSKNLTKNC